MKNKKFTKNDLKVGYVLEQRNGVMVMVMDTRNVGRAYVEEDGSMWIEESKYGDDLVYKSPYVGSLPELDIVAVYGFCDNPRYSREASTRGRELLWDREEAKKMTVEEIEKELGYKIEIVS